MAEESQAVSKARWKVRKGKQEAAEPPGGCRVDGGVRAGISGAVTRGQGGTAEGGVMGHPPLCLAAGSRRGERLGGWNRGLGRGDGHFGDNIR